MFHTCSRTVSGAASLSVTTHPDLSSGASWAWPGASTNAMAVLPSKLSGGEKERVAVARALANAPGVLLADEPTGNLDAGTSGVVFEGLLRMVRMEGVVALIATHNPELAARMDRRVTLQGGRVIELHAEAPGGRETEANYARRFV